MEPSSLAREQRKLLLWLTLACLNINLDRKRIDWQVEQKVSQKKTPIENGRGLTESGRGREIFARNTVVEPPLSLKSRPATEGE